MNTETTRILKQIISVLKKQKIKGTRQNPLPSGDLWSRGINRGYDLSISIINDTLKNGVVPKE